jgi:hypothetical protein
MQFGWLGPLGSRNLSSGLPNATHSRADRAMKWATALPERHNFYGGFQTDSEGNSLSAYSVLIPYGVF